MGEEEKDEGDENEQSSSYLDRKLGRSAPAPNPFPEIQTPARPTCCRCESPIGEVEEGGFIDSGGGVVFN